jgi:hypothetical protein
MSRKNCIRAAVGRRSIGAPFSLERVLTACHYCFEPWRAMTPGLIVAASVFFRSPMAPATIPLVNESKGERRAPRFND